MQYPSAFIALFAATAVLAVPLNINLGAYSPALVVGDGAIGFKGTESVAAIMNTLEGAAANSAATNGAAAKTTTTQAVTQAGVTQNEVTQEQAPVAAAAAPATVDTTGSELPQGMGKNKAVVSRQEDIEDEEDLEDEEAEQKVR